VLGVDPDHVAAACHRYGAAVGVAVDGDLDRGPLARPEGLDDVLGDLDAGRGLDDRTAAVTVALERGIIRLPG
jgi:hypothetical protein